MSTTYPFTTEGMNDFIAALYGLPDADLLVQANAVKDDLVSFVNTNFDLTDDQQSFLNAQNELVLNEMGAIAAVCFANRLPIILIMDAPVEGLYKYMQTASTVTITAQADGTYTATGTLIIRILYLA